MKNRSGEKIKLASIDELLGVVNDDQHQFGGPGNGYFVAGDMNTYGRVYMSTVGLGVVYGDLVQ